MRPRAIVKRIVCEKFHEKQETEGGILLPDTHTKDQMKYKIVSMGKEVSSELNLGNIVLIDGFQGHNITVDGEKYRVFEESQILAVISD